mmetsp:Transcript_39639/g.119045  ORF Transcript_39639/g.119045 Transcript_39639/m.119045 type:complete len:279 (-) Transcript_39639:207-1043(-)
MAQYDRLPLDLGCIAVLPSEHVHLPLINSQLTNVGPEEEHVRALHQRVQYLRRCQGSLESPHDLAALLDASDVESSGDVEHGGPVDVGPIGDLLRGPLEHDVGKVHPCRLPHLDEVMSDNLNFGEVPSHLVIHQREPVGDPEHEGGIGAFEGAFVHVHGLKHALGDVHPPAGLEPIVKVESRMATPPPLRRDQPLQFPLRDALLPYRQHPIQIFLQVGRPLPLRFFGFLLAATAALLLFLLTPSAATAPAPLVGQLEIIHLGGGLVGLNLGALLVPVF